MFNLIDEPFIPVLRADGTPAEYSLRATLHKAGEIVELRDASPLVTVALHRLLLAILHRVYGGPKTKAARLAIRKAGAFDTAKIDAYFAKWNDRFDLFHEAYPFFQRAGFKSDDPGGANTLAQEMARGNNVTLFDHTVDDPPPAMSPARAARSLIADQGFAVGGGKSLTGNRTHGSLLRGAVSLVLGATLFETLWLNLVVYDGSQMPVACDSDDALLWERDPKPPHEQPNVPMGYLDYLTWPARTVALHPEDEDGRVVIRRVTYSQGRKFEPKGAFYDPMLAYFRDADEGDKPVRFNEFRDLWRDSSALFQFGETNQTRGPAVLEGLKALSADDLPRNRTYQVSMFGLAMDSRQAAKTLFWRHETLPLRLEYLDDPSAVVHLQHALTLAEEVSKVALRPAAWAVASNRLTASADSSPDKGRVAQLVDAMAPERYYWSRLELKFRAFMVGLAKAPADDRAGVVHAWYWDDLRETAEAAFERCVAVVDAGRDLKAVNAGAGVLRARLKQIQSDNQIPAREKAGAA